MGRCMSKDLRKSAAKLEREAASRVETIRRVVGEYRDSVEEGPAYDLAQQVRKKREIECVVAELVQIHKALKRIKRKMRISKTA